MCESGVAPKGGCLGGEGTITSIAMTFNTYVVADKTLGGKTVQVLFGGIQWGFKYQNSDKAGIVIADAPRPGGGALSLATELRAYDAERELLRIGQPPIGRLPGDLGAFAGPRSDCQRKTEMAQGAQS